MRSYDPVLVCLTFVFVWKTCLGICPVNYVEYDGMCYKLTLTPVDHETARQTCADSQGNLASIKTSQMAHNIKTAVASQGNVSTIWSRYVLHKHGSNDPQTVDGSNVVDCDGCTSLFTDFLNLGVEQYCIVIGGISAASADWQLSNCNSANSYICEIQFSQSEAVLTTFDLVAIGCGVFLVLSFIVVMVVDIVKNPSTPVLEDIQPIQP